jgi:DNA-binding IclR family transcriptional regulator
VSFAISKLPVITSCCITATKKDHCRLTARRGEADLATRRAKAKGAEKQAARSPARAKIARLVVPASGDIDDDPENHQRGGAQSLGRAFAILEEVARNREGIGLADLSKRVGLHNSTTFHLVKTIVSLGYIRQDRGVQTLSCRPAAVCARGELARRDRDDQPCKADPGRPIATNRRKCAFRRSHGRRRGRDCPGVVRPANCTALGKVILAALRPDQLDRYIKRTEFEAMTAKSIVDTKTLLQEIEDVRRGGMAFDDGEFDPEIRCVAVPVRDFTGQVVGALGISCPVWRLSMQALQTRGKIVQSAAHRLSTEFGARS